MRYKTISLMHIVCTRLNTSSASCQAPPDLTGFTPPRHESARRRKRLLSARVFTLHGFYRAFYSGAARRSSVLPQYKGLSTLVVISPAPLTVKPPISTCAERPHKRQGPAAAPSALSAVAAIIKRHDDTNIGRPIPLRRRYGFQHDARGAFERSAGTAPCREWRRHFNGRRSGRHERRERSVLPRAARR